MYLNHKNAMSWKEVSLIVLRKVLFGGRNGCLSSQKQNSHKKGILISQAKSWRDVNGNEYYRQKW